MATIDAMFPGFDTRKIQTSGATIHTRRGGSGPPLLLLHGYPQTHVEWHKIGPRLAERFTVVLTDLRGYGDSSKPAEGEVPLPYSMVTRELATQYFHWFFLIQPAPVPETLIGHNPEFYLRSRFMRPTGGTGAIAPEAFAEYLRCFKDPATIRATCEDYRAGATIDLEHSGEDGTRRVLCPLLVLWGERGTVGRLYDVLSVWRDHAMNVTGKALPAGHFLPEEVPDDTLAALLPFLEG